MNLHVSTYDNFTLNMMFKTTTTTLKAFFKSVGDKESSWHQDQQAAPVTTDKFVTLWIPLEELDADQGQCDDVIEHGAVRVRCS